MVILVERFHKLYNKLENHHHHHSQGLSASLHAFRSDLSNCINQLSSNLKPGFESLSLSWFQQLLQLIPMMNKAFAKLVVDINYPMTKWKVKSIEEYLKHSLNLLDLLNSISKSLSHLSQSRILIAHALSLVENSPSLAVERLKPIFEFIMPRKDHCKYQESMEDEKQVSCSDKEKIIHEALLELKNVGLWVCFLALASISDDDHAKTCLKLKINPNSAITGVVLSGIELKEIKELKDAAVRLADGVVAGKSGSPAEEMQRKLEVFEKQVDGLGKEVDHHFSQVLAGRIELIDGIRYLE